MLTQKGQGLPDVMDLANTYLPNKKMNPLNLIKILLFMKINLRFKVSTFRTHKNKSTRKLIS